MGDRRVRQHALEVGLRQGDQVADHQREQGKPGQHLPPLLGGRGEAGVEQAVGEAEGGDLRHRADEQGDGRGRALVDVGHPHMERRGAELEGHAHQHEDQAEQQQAAVVDAGRGLVDRAEVETAGGAVDHRHAVEQQAGGQRAQHEVLHGRLGGDLVVAVDGNEAVGAERQHLEAEVEHHEMAAGDHHHHAQQGEQHDGVELAGHQAALLERWPCIGEHHAGDGAHGDLQHVGGEIAHEHATEGGERLAPHATGDEQGRGEQGEHGKRMDQAAAARIHEQVGEQETEGGAAEHDLRQDRHEVGAGGQGHHRDQVSVTASRVWWPKAATPAAPPRRPSGR